MISIKSILPFLLLIICLTSANAQTNGNRSEQISDSSSYKKLQKFRQTFWDSLPNATGWTNDYERLFTDAEVQKLDSIISAFEMETTVQFCIVTLDTMYTSIEKFDDLAFHIANTWGVGQEDQDNGVTICISKGYSRIRICNGDGITQILSDDETEQIMNTYFISEYKQGNFFQGTLNGLNAFINTLRQKLK